MKGRKRKENKINLFIHTYRYNLIRVRHHGNKHVQKHYDVDNGVRSESEERPESSETLDACQFEGCQVHQTEGRPKQ